MAVAQPTGPGVPDLREPAGWRRTKNSLMTTLMWMAFVVTLVPLVLAIYTVIAKGAGAINWQFLTSHTTPRIGPPLPNIPGLNFNTGGAGPAIVGTLVITGLASVIAIPLGVLGAVYIQEYGGKGFLAKFISFMADVMTGVPSIVMGLFIYTIWVLHFGYSGMAGSFALACLMLPIVIKSTQEMLKLVPDALRQGSYALGATKSRVTLTVVLPAAVGGIVSGALLAVARAAGETAPLLFTIFVVEATNPNVFSGANTALSTVIFANATSPYPNVAQYAWGSALTLIVIAFLLMVIARLVTARFTRYMR